MEAWCRGDFETIERILDPDVEWRWFEPGDWDCHNRDDVMRVLRQRFDQGFAKGDLTFRGAGEDVVVVVAGRFRLPHQAASRSSCRQISADHFDLGGKSNLDERPRTRFAPQKPSISLHQSSKVAYRRSLRVGGLETPAPDGVSAGERAVNRGEIGCSIGARPWEVDGRAHTLRLSH
jgi:hypothetical protein